MSFVGKWTACTLSMYTSLRHESKKEPKQQKPSLSATQWFRHAFEACRSAPDSTHPYLIKRIVCKRYSEPHMNNTKDHLMKQLRHVENESRVRRAMQGLDWCLPFVDLLHIDRTIFMVMDRTGLDGETAWSRPQRLDVAGATQAVAVYTPTDLTEMFRTASKMNRWLQHMRVHKSKVVHESFGTSILRNLNNLLYRKSDQTFVYAECCGTPHEEHTLHQQDAVLSLRDALQHAFLAVLVWEPSKPQDGVRMVVGLGPTFALEDLQHAKQGGGGGGGGAEGVYNLATRNKTEGTLAQAFRHSLAQLLLPHWI